LARSDESTIWIRRVDNEWAVEPSRQWSNVPQYLTGLCGHYLFVGKGMLRVNSAVFLGLVFVLAVSSLSIAGRFTGTSLGIVPGYGAGDPSFPGVGVKVNLFVNGTTRYVNFSDYFYVMHGWVSDVNWSSVPPAAQNAFLDPAQTNFTLETNDSRFLAPSMTQFVYYNSSADAMSTFFYYQFLPGDLAPGAYSFTGIWSMAAAADFPNYTGAYNINRITLVVNQYGVFSETFVSCSPNPVSVGVPVACSANVSGSSPTGTVTWSTSSVAGSFTQSVCPVVDYQCSTTYFDNSSGCPVITATYSGDVNNTESSGTCTLIVTLGGPIYYTSNYTSVQATVDAASVGATVVVTPGLYTASVVVNKSLTIIGDKDPPVFMGGGSGIAITLLSGASGSIVAGITMTGWDTGVLISNASGCNIYDNIMSMMNANAVVLQGSDAVGNQVLGNIFEQTAVAVDLGVSSSSSTVSQNVMSLSTVGVKVESSGNTICSNILSENQVGLNLTGSDDNVIYHNTFVDNAVQVVVSNSAGNVWDDGYPSGGNYWSDHISPDVHSGPNQDQVGNDGIVDVPYTIASGSVDRYPLANGAIDVGVTLVITSKTIVGQGYNVLVELKIMNYGAYDEKSILTAYANMSTAATQNVALSKGSFTVVTLTWSTMGFQYGKYVMSAYWQPVQGETNTANNLCFGGNMTVTIPGDLQADSTVDIYDAIILAGAFNTNPSSPHWNANADINSDNSVDIYDAIILAGHFNQHVP
jgi:parallel beta-helix repeat protein